MRITHSGEDDNLKRLLSFSVSALKGDCGPFDINGTTDIDNRAKELVFERTRYVYNDALEFFENNFLSDITGLGLDIEMERMANETI
ncbi:phage gp6-like head-tail connector protein [Lentibacillus saliphilus]|uniref:phage gp6-like head-tail connector protein n=1 Tax=Lentibacillus saliphilus TaxID=2737028 RepID=UPI001C2F5BD6|nr:phage gp6-like head-tail connector protein [Lentibacillus saliphilus]